MHIPEDLLAKLCLLAQIRLEDAEARQFAAGLDHLLEMIEAVQSAPTADIPPLPHPLRHSLPLRPDLVDEKNQREVFQQLAPLTDSGLYLVPKVIDS